MLLTRRHFLATASVATAIPAALTTSLNAADSSAAPASVASVTPIDIQPVIAAALAAVSAAQLAPGRYSRFIGTQRTKRPRGAELNAYGCSAAACILYTTGHFPRTADERAAFITALQDNQSPTTGLFSEPSHNPTHSTAYVSAALELFDATPLHPLRDLQPLLAPGAIEKLLDGLDWLKKPWPASHYGAGSFAALYLSGEATPEWQDRYFTWLWNEQDPFTGLWRRGCQPPQTAPDAAPLFHHVASSFHYVFNHVAARRPLRYPEAMIDSALRIRREKLQALGEGGAGFSELDWAYCLTRPLRQSGHRFAEVQSELRSFTIEYANNLLANVAKNSTPFEDLHTLNGTVSALAELQQTFPGLLRSERPLKLTLDRRPFI